MEILNDTVWYDEEDSRNWYDKHNEDEGKEWEGTLNWFDRADEEHDRDNDERED